MQASTQNIVRTKIVLQDSWSLIEIDVFTRDPSGSPQRDTTTTTGDNAVIYILHGRYYLQSGVELLSGRVCSNRSSDSFMTSRCSINLGHSR
jgi:hypothetical protein